MICMTLKFVKKSWWSELKFSYIKDALHYITLLFKFLNLTDMLYHGNLILLILLLISQVPVGSGYNCSDFSGFYPVPLVECPPAKFMLQDNLVECFDNYTKNGASNSMYPLDLSICTWFLKNFWKIKLEKSSWWTGFLVYFELDFYCLQKSISKLVFAG